MFLTTGIKKKKGQLSQLLFADKETQSCSRRCRALSQKWRKTSKRLSRNNIITTGRQNNNSALHYLCRSGEANAHYVSILVDAKVEVNCRNDNGRTALHSTCAELFRSHV
jgi:hypothetical protein